MSLNRGLAAGLEEGWVGKEIGNLWDDLRFEMMICKNLGRNDCFIYYLISEDSWKFEV
jgi:hypothetical protein